MSGQFLAALLSREKSPVPTEYEVESQSRIWRSGKEKILGPVETRTPTTSVVQIVTSRHTGRAIFKFM
jgi:hypothetical protein